MGAWTSYINFPPHNVFCFRKAAYCFSFKSAFSPRLTSFLHAQSQSLFYIFFTIVQHIFSNSKIQKMKYFSLIAIAVAATIVKAQTPDACILNCALAACPSGLTDLSCFCVTGTAAIGACIQQNCTAADLQTALALSTSVCSTISPSS